jgi:hypothetical protein
MERHRGFQREDEVIDVPGDGGSVARDASAALIFAASRSQRRVRSLK